MPKVFIIILNWNGLKDVVECLESIRGLDYPDFEVIVVDNGSSDGSVEIIRNKYQEVVLLTNSENLGFTAGNNIGMRYAIECDADYVWLLNNDTVVEKDSLSKLVQTAENSSDVGMVSPVVRFYYQPETVQFNGSFIDMERMAVIYPEENCVDVSEQFVRGETTTLWGTALLVKRKVIEEIGYLRQEYFAYWEDTDYCIRAIRNGFRNVVTTTATIYHKTVPPKPGIKRRGNHFYYYMARNRYFWGMLYSRGFRRLSFLRDCFADLLRLCNMARQGVIVADIAEAHLTGVGDALAGKTGQWDGVINPPVRLKKICNFLCSWHPFFWIDLLNGEIGKIGSEIYSRTKSKFMKLLS
jgi:hypothetical protein